MKTLDLTDDIIDVRDIIARIEELEARNQPQWVAGWNMPGYMPDSEPSVFEYADAALEYIKDTILDVDPEQARHEGFEEFADSLKADDNGELGVNFGGYHYFIVKHTDGFDSCLDADEKEELSALLKLIEELETVGGGDEQWNGNWYPITLIADSHFTDYARELLEDCGDIPSNIPHYIEIDWEQTARNIRVDYTPVEINGSTYWTR